MNHRVFWVSSLFALAAACGGRSTEVNDDESPDEPIDGAGGTQAMGGSGSGPSAAGSGGAQGIAGSGGSQGIAGSGGSGGSQGIAGTGGSQGIAGTGGTSATNPTGEGQPCVSDADCAGRDATFCDTFVSQTCLVRGCTLAPDSCSAGKECCDLAAFGFPETLCIEAGACVN